MEEEAEDVAEEEESVDVEGEEETVDEEEEDEEYEDEAAEEDEEVEEEENVDEVEDDEEVEGEGEEEMAFNGAFTPKTETIFSLRDATVNVSTLLMIFAVAMVVMIGRNCFWKMYHQKAAKKGVAVNYGTVTV